MFPINQHRAAVVAVVRKSTVTCIKPHMLMASLRDVAPFVNDHDPDQAIRIALDECLVTDVLHADFTTGGTVACYRRNSAHPVWRPVEPETPSVQIMSKPTNQADGSAPPVATQP